MLLFDTTSRSAEQACPAWAVSLNQPWLVAVMGISPPPGSPAAAPFA
ncbi:MAG: hypothetical protein LKJ27_05180 [Clostridiales bacterium]|nr:hypothetical protein [Clostridiales bacterium]